MNFHSSRALFLQCSILDPTSYQIIDEKHTYTYVHTFALDWYTWLGQSPVSSLYGCTWNWEMWANVEVDFWARLRKIFWWVINHWRELLANTEDVLFITTEKSLLYQSDETGFQNRNPKYGRYTRSVSCQQITIIQRYTVCWSQSDHVEVGNQFGVSGMEGGP